MTREVDPLIERIDQVLAEDDEPAKACGGVLSAGPIRYVADEPGPAPLVLPADRAPAAAAYVGFDEGVEPRADQTRGWLARLFERWSR